MYCFLCILSINKNYVDFFEQKSCKIVKMCYNILVYPDKQIKKGMRLS